jgi:GNAT superfamily N-acetyltransferase
MRIDPLSRHKNLISVIASRLHAEWGDLPPWETTVRIEARLEQGACTKAFPHTLVGIDQNGNWTSTGSVKQRELPHHPDKEHWVGEIFVLPAHRGRGLGSAFTSLLAEYAFGHGVSQLFLYTPDQQALYRRLGWKDVCQEVVHNESVSIMALTLSAHRARRGAD